jgi:hypothetical protein
MDTSSHSIKRAFHAISPSGEERLCELSVDLPLAKPGGEWGAVVNIEGLEARSHEIFGVDAWQAVQLGMRFLATRLENFESDGWRYFWEVGGEQACAQSLAGSILLCRKELPVNTAQVALLP